MKTPSTWFLYLFFFAALSPLLGCPAAEVAATETVLQTALSDLTQNRALTEQFVRDVKASVRQDDPAYVQAMESYGDARETYNRFLDAVEGSSANRDSRSLRNCSPRDVENATADFLADATRALKPLANTRKIAFQRAVIVPEDLQPALARLPKKARRQITDNFDDEVRWRRWTEL